MGVVVPPGRDGGGSMRGFDPDPAVPAAPPLGSRAYSLTGAEFERQNEAWRQKSLSGELDHDLRVSEAYNSFLERRRVRELYGAAVLVLVTFPVTGILPGMMSLVAERTADANIVQIMARVGECERFGGPVGEAWNWDGAGAANAPEVERLRGAIAAAAERAAVAAAVLAAVFCAVLCYRRAAPWRASRVATRQAVGPGAYCSPRHRMPFNSRIERSQRVSMTWRVTSACP